jgi:hypothetical protein
VCVCATGARGVCVYVQDRAYHPKVVQLTYPYAVIVSQVRVVVVAVAVGVVFAVVVVEVVVEVVVAVVVVAVVVVAVVVVVAWYLVSQQVTVVTFAVDLRVVVSVHSHPHAAFVVFVVDVLVVVALVVVAALEASG